MKNFNRGNRFDKRSSGRFHDERPKRFGRGDSPRTERRESGRFERRYPERSFEKRMHEVTCATCGERCEVPFRPRENKPVYCSTCFRKNDDFEPKRPAPSKSELDQINKKLDKIMRALKIE